MRWLYHLLPLADRVEPIEDRFVVPSLASEGFVHASFRDALLESARLYFSGLRSDEVEVLQIDPRRLDVPLELASTPRGPMPHIHGSIPADAIRARLSPEAGGGGPARGP